MKCVGNDFSFINVNLKFVAQCVSVGLIEFANDPFDTKIIIKTNCY